MDDKLITTGILGIQTLSAMRIETTAPVVYRQVIYPNNRIALQGGYHWQQGNEGGITWRDLPLIAVDKDGQEKEPNT